MTWPRSPALLCALMVAGLLVTACGGPTDESSDRSEARPNLDEDAKVLLYQTRRALHDGNLRRALVRAESLEAVTDSLAEAAFLRGRILSRLKFFEEAGEAYRTGISRDSTRPGGWFRLGHNAYQRGQYRSAIRYYERELAVRRRLQPDSTFPGVLIQMGRAYRQLNESDSALSVYRKVLEARPDHPTAHADLSQLHRTRGNLEQAYEHARRALRGDSTRAVHRYLLGSILLDMGRAEEAIPHLRRVLERAPGYHQAIYELGRALLRTGSAEEGREYIALADSLQQLQGKIQQARATAEGSRNVNDWLELGDLLTRARRYRDARETYRIAAQLDPQNREVRKQLRQLRSRGRTSSP